MKKYFALLMMLGLCVSGFAQTTKARRADGTECASLPCVVASISLTDQTSPVSQVPLIVPGADGLYRVTFYLESSHVKGSVWGISFNWTDDLRNWTTENYFALAGTEYSWMLNLRALAGEPISYTITRKNNPPGATYSLFVTVEQLQ